MKYNHLSFHKIKKLSTAIGVQLSIIAIATTLKWGDHFAFQQIGATYFALDVVLSLMIEPCRFLNIKDLVSVNF